MAAKKLNDVEDRIRDRNRSRKDAEDAQRRAAEKQAVSSHANAVAAQTAAGAAPAPSEQAVSASDLRAGGTVLRIPAGGTATLRLSDVAGWHYDRAVLRLDPYGRNMALPLTLERSTPGPGTFAAALTYAPSPPLFVGSLVYGYLGADKTAGRAKGRGVLVIERGDTLEVEVDGAATSLTMSTKATGTPLQTESTYIGGHVSKLTLKQRRAQSPPHRITAILPNTADGLTVAQADDTVLHRVPRKLATGERAETGDLSDYLNAQSRAGAAEAVFRIGARGDCCVSLSLDLTRRRVAEGVQGGAVPEEIALSLWHASALAPNLPAGASVTTTLAAHARPSGPARAGLRAANAVALCQEVSLPPRVSLLQPFRLPAPGTEPRRIAGVWLCLPAPPQSAQSLHVDLAGHDPEAGTLLETRATAKTEISDRQMDLAEIGGGLFAHWVAFDSPAEIDTPDLGAPFALVLRDLSGPVPLLECALTGSALSPALSRDVARSDRWTQRRFGHPAKALVFDLGETGESALLTVTAGSETQSVVVPESGTDIALTLPGAPALVLSADRDLTLSDVSLRSASAPEG